MTERQKLRRRVTINALICMGVMYAVFAFTLGKHFMEWHIPTRGLFAVLCLIISAIWSAAYWTVYPLWLEQEELEEQREDKVLMKEVTEDEEQENDC